MVTRFLNRRGAKPSPDAMTLVEHLGELRRRLVISVAAYVVAATVAAFLYSPILHLLLNPLCDVHEVSKVGGHGNCSLYVTSPLDGLSLRIKIAAFGGLLFSSPVILWELWRFITPGLKANERRYAVPFVLSSCTLFLAGCATAYLVLPHALGFLRSVGGPQLQEIYDPIPYIGLILLMMFLFGITFELPVILVSLELARVVSSSRLLGWWRWAVIIIVVAAAVFTPSADPFSMLVLAVPLTLFYFVSIIVGKLLRR